MGAKLETREESIGEDPAVYQAVSGSRACSGGNLEAESKSLGFRSGSVKHPAPKLRSQPIHVIAGPS